jgi:Right handed beta helix region
VKHLSAGSWTGLHAVNTQRVTRGRPRPLLAALVTVMAAAAPASAGASTFYVSPSGSDSSSGKSPARAWRTLYRVNKAPLKPGDEVLFKGGSTFADEALMPGWGTAVSGTNHRPVVFGSYGDGLATLPQGIWLKGEQHLVFQDLNLGPTQGVQGTGNRDVVQGCSIKGLMSGTGEIAINVMGSRWTIRNNTIDRTGDSGMLVRGDHFVIAGNSISDTGLDPNLAYGTHGIYLKAADSKVIGNTITRFRDDGISVRYRGSVIKANKISGGEFGIAWHQYDTIRGTSRWVDNTISFTTIAGIYISPQDIGGATNENFVIRGNRISRPGGKQARVADIGGWTAVSLSHNRGHYRVRGNRVV